jgi:hypothetical protein
MFPAPKNRKQRLQERNSFLGGKEAESVIKNLSDISTHKTFWIRTCLANSFMIGNFSIPAQAFLKRMENIGTKKIRFQGMGALMAKMLTEEKG